MKFICYLNNYINQAIFKMHSIDLTKILKEIPIILKDRIVWRTSKDSYFEAEAIALKNNKLNLRYTIMNYNCDNLAQTLLHESLHHHYPEFPEKTIEKLTNIYWKSEHRKLVQNKLIEKLGEYDL